MKKGAIIGKRQILLAVLVVALSAAVYLNWQFSKNGGEYDITGALSSTTSYLGDVQYVGNPGDTTVSEAQSADNYFAQAREDRAAARQDERHRIIVEIAHGEHDGGQQHGRFNERQLDAHKCLPGIGAIHTGSLQQPFVHAFEPCQDHHHGIADGTPCHHHDERDERSCFIFKNSDRRNTQTP